MDTVLLQYCYLSCHVLTEPNHNLDLFFNDLLQLNQYAGPSLAVEVVQCSCIDQANLTLWPRSLCTVISNRSVCVLFDWQLTAIKNSHDLMRTNFEINLYVTLQRFLPLVLFSKISSKGGELKETAISLFSFRTAIIFTPRRLVASIFTWNNNSLSYRHIVSIF